MSKRVDIKAILADPEQRAELVKGMTDFLVAVGRDNTIVVPPEDEEDDLPCERSPDTDPDGTPVWNCDNDHTGCFWNDGHNTCMHAGDSLHPLEEDTE
jgi:hypothetical protein